jgi:3-dehydroquinate synthase
MRPPFPTIQQDIQVRFSYPVHFTRDLFAVSNPLVRNIVAEDGAGPPAKLLVVLDRGVHRRHPRILSGIEVYCRHHHTAVTLAGGPLLFEGGEQLKNDPRQVKRLQQAIHT